MKALPTSLTSLVNQVHRIPLRLIREDAVELRTEYDEESLAELADSLKERQLQPVVVQPGDCEHFELIIGSRRMRAARKRNDVDILAYVIERKSPVELLIMALAENLQRVDLNPFEEAQGLLRLVKEHGLSVAKVSERVGKSPSYIRTRLELLSMPDDVQKLVAEHKLSLTTIPVLARLPSGEEQVHFAHQTVDHKLSSTEVRAEVARQRKDPKPVPRSWKYELTSVKLNAKIEEFTDWLQKVPRRTNVKKMNSAEKTNVFKKLQSLEHEVKLLLSVFGANYSEPESSASNITRNHREQWSNRDIKRIHARSRPSDEELALELGRTVTAIRAMRAQTKEPY